jgi:hypothetical protein
MNARRLLVGALLTLPLFALSGLALANSGDGNEVRAARQALAPFHSADAARAAGYDFRLPELSGKTCIVEPGAGAMGVHLVNTSLLDATLDPAAPEALVYEPHRNGKLKLVAAEYVVFKDAWDAAHSSPPTLFGRQFDFTPEGNRYGLPAFYALHAWLFRSNPSGMFFAWNPKIDCDGS